MDYKKSVSIRTTKEAAFEALTKGIDKWWGNTDKPVEGKGDIFTVSWGEPYYRFKVIEFEPSIRITWECIESKQIIGDLEGVEKEWVGTKLFWNIQGNGDNKVTVSLLHQGLVPGLICYDVCSSTWDSFIGESLKNYLEKNE